MLRDAKAAGYRTPDLRELYSRDLLGRLDRGRDVADIDPYTEAERDEIIEGFRTKRAHYHPFVAHQFWSGARPSEAIALRWVGVDFSQREIRIRGSRVLGQDPRTKTGKSVRNVIMHHPVADALRAVWPTHPAADGFVFTTPSGAPLDEANFYRREWIPMLRRLGIRQRGLYNTRHTYITYMLELTGNPLFVARQTGTSLEMIEKHDGAVRVLADEIDERIADRRQTGNPPGTPRMPALGRSRMRSKTP